MKPKCEKCGRKGMLDQGLCAFCYKDKTGEWSSKFMGAEEKKKVHKK